MPRQGSMLYKEDNNVINAIKVGCVSSSMIEDREISQVSDLMGWRWHSVKHACLERAVWDQRRADAAATGTSAAGWIVKPRGSNKIDMKIFDDWCHDETVCRFASQFSKPLKIYTAPREYELHWRLERPGAPSARSTRMGQGSTPPQMEMFATWAKGLFSSSSCRMSTTAGGTRSACPPKTWTGWRRRIRPRAMRTGSSARRGGGAHNQRANFRPRGRYPGAQRIGCGFRTLHGPKTADNGTKTKKKRSDAQISL